MNESFFDVPAGYNDADMEMAALTAQGNRESRLRKRGICTHGWTQMHADKTCTCLHCNAVFTSWEACMDSRREALS